MAGSIDDVTLWVSGMSFETELAGWIVDLEQRVERLKTLEDAPPGGGAGAWTFIDSDELLADGPSLEISGIPQTYTDLMIIWRARSAKIGVPNRENFVARFNDDAVAANYDSAFGFGNSTLTCRQDCGFVIIGDIISAAATGDAEDFSHGIHHIPEYTNTDYALTSQGVMGAYGYTAVFGYNGNSSGAWKKAGYEAVTSIKFFSISAADLIAGSIVELYGLAR